MSSAGNRKQHAILEDRATSPSPSQLCHKPAQLWRQEKKDSVLKPRFSSLKESHFYTLTSPHPTSQVLESFPPPFLADDLAKDHSPSRLSSKQGHFDKCGGILINMLGHSNINYPRPRRWTVTCKISLLPSLHDRFLMGSGGKRPTCRNRLFPSGGSVQSIHSLWISPPSLAQGTYKGNNWPSRLASLNSNVIPSFKL